MPNFLVGDTVYCVDDDEGKAMRVEGVDALTLAEPVYVCEWETRDRAGEEDNTFLESQLVAYRGQWRHVQNMRKITEAIDAIRDDMVVIATMIDSNDPRLTSGLITTQRHALEDLRKLVDSLL